MTNDRKKTHDVLVADWKENAEKHDDENYWFLRSLKQRSLKKADRIAARFMQHFLNFLPLPHGHGSFRPTCFSVRKNGVSFRPR